MSATSDPIAETGNSKFVVFVDQTEGKFSLLNLSE